MTNLPPVRYPRLACFAKFVGHTIVRWGDALDGPEPWPDDGVLLSGHKYLLPDGVSRMPDDFWSALWDSPRASSS